MNVNKNKQDSLLTKESANLYDSNMQKCRNGIYIYIQGNENEVVAVVEYTYDG